MQNAPRQPGTPRKHSKFKEKFLPLALAGSLLAHALTIENREIRTVIDDTRSGISKYFKQMEIDSLLNTDFAKLKGVLSERQISVVKDRYARSEMDKKMAAERVKQRETESKKFLTNLRDHYDTLDPKEVIWLLEYYFQGVRDENYAKAHAVVDEKVFNMDLQGQAEPTVADLVQFHKTFVPQGPRDPIKSSAVEFLASHLDSRLENCDAAAKTLIIALLTKYPKLRSSIYFQFFKGHVRLIVDLQGQKYIFEWKSVNAFPDPITQEKRNFIIPVDVYFGLAAGNRDSALLRKVQLFGEKPKHPPGYVNVPIFTNSGLPAFNVNEELGEYASIGEEEGASLMKGKTNLEAEKIRLKYKVPLVIPAKTDDEKRRLALYLDGSGFEFPPGDHSLSYPPEVLIKMDQISMPELEKTLNSQPNLLIVIKPIFTGLKKMDDKTFEFIMKIFWSTKSFAFEDLEEMSSEQLAKLFERTGGADERRKRNESIGYDKKMIERAEEAFQTRAVDFYSLKNIKGNKVIRTIMPLGDFDVNDLLLGVSKEDEVNIKKTASAESPTPPVRYKKVHFGFHALNDMSNETADWLAGLSGNITFGLEANLTAAVSERLVPFNGSLVVENSNAISLVQGLKNRRTSLSYRGHELTQDMAEALTEYQGDVDVYFLRDYSSTVETLVKKTGKLSMSVPNIGKPGREAFFRALGQKKGYLLLENNDIDAKDTAFLKERDGDLELSFLGYTGRRANLYLDFTGFKSGLIFNIFPLDLDKECFKKLADNNFWVTVQVGHNTYLDPSLNEIAPNLRFVTK